MRRWNDWLSVSKCMERYSLQVYSILVSCWIADHIRSLSCGKLYYRTSYLDAERDVLYVGAMWVLILYCLFKLKKLMKKKLKSCFVMGNDTTFVWLRFAVIFLCGGEWRIKPNLRISNSCFDNYGIPMYNFRRVFCHLLIEIIFADSSRR